MRDLVRVRRPDQHQESVSSPIPPIQIPVRYRLDSSDINMPIIGVGDMAIAERRAR